MKKIIIILFTCFLGLSESYGCSCDTISFEKATEWADEIFFGRLVQLREVATSEESDETPHTRIWGALFEVEKKWKGDNNNYVEVFQPNTSCDYHFSFPNRPYVVYAKKGELIDWDSIHSFVGFRTWLCARNADASTYNLWAEDGFDDRSRLDKKYPNTVKLSELTIQRKWIVVGLSIFILSLILLDVMKNRNASN